MCRLFGRRLDQGVGGHVLEERPKREGVQHILVLSVSFFRCMAEMAYICQNVSYTRGVLVTEKKFAHILAGQAIGLAEAAYNAVERLIR